MNRQLPLWRIQQYVEWPMHQVPQRILPGWRKTNFMQEMSHRVHYIICWLRCRLRLQRCEVVTRVCVVLQWMLVEQPLKNLRSNLSDPGLLSLSSQPLVSLNEYSAGVISRLAIGSRCDTLHQHITFLVKWNPSEERLPRCSPYTSNSQLQTILFRIIEN